jgi:hypothetical protein
VDQVHPVASRGLIRQRALKIVIEEPLDPLVERSFDAEIQAEVSALNGARITGDWRG